MATQEEESTNDSQDEKTNNSIVWGIIWLVGGLLITLLSYSAAVGGGTYIVTYGAIAYGAIRLLTGLFSKKLQYGLIGLGGLILLGLGIYLLMSRTESAQKQKIQIEQNEKFNRLNSATMNIINPFDDKQVSITIPNTMVKERFDEDTNLISEYEEYYNISEDIFRISISRILKSNIRDDIKNLSNFVTILQEPSDSLDKRRFEIDPTNIKCLAEKNGYDALYYKTYIIGYKSDFWGKVVYVNGKQYYYLITVWTHPNYKTEFKNLIDKVIESFNIEN